MNPFDLGMMSLAGFNNPEAFANVMASSGISPGGIASAPPALASDPLGGYFTQNINPEATAMPAAPGVMPGAAPAAPVNPMAALAGFKAPQVDNKPIMNAGVSGAQKAPDAQAIGNPQVMQMLQTLMGAQGKSDPLRVPSLGALLGGM